MRVKLLHSGGYDGLAEVQFPVEVEVERKGYSLYYISYDVISALPGWFYSPDDVYEGCEYAFYGYEVQVMEEEEVSVDTPRTLYDCFNPNPTEEALAANQRAANLSMQDMITVSGTFVQNVADAGRKDKLISLVQEYGEAISGVYYESECGSIEAMLACHEEEKRLLKEIIKMIEEGV